MSKVFVNIKHLTVLIYHDFSNLFRVVSIEVKPEGHHLPIVGL